MSNDITLSAGVRQNLLSLQNTASLMALTQNRLATGKKVNSALDNPSNFFTSQALNDRASDLNSLLDSIGQAQKTLEAADKGITSLTKLVESAKSIAKQARQAAQPVAAYAAVNVSSDIASAANLNGDEAIGEVTGNIGAPVNNMSAQAISLSFTTQAESIGSTTATVGFDNTLAATAALSFDVTIGGTTTTVTTAAFTGGESATQVRDAINAAMTTAFGTGSKVVASVGGTNQITLAASDADVDFSIEANATTLELGLTTGAVSPTNDVTVNSTSLLDNIVAAGGAAGNSLSLSVNGGAAQTVTFTTAAGAGNVSTLAELNTYLSGITGGASSSITSTTFALANPSGDANSIGLTVTGGSNGAAVKTALGLGGARTAGQGGGLGTAATRTFNSAATLSDLDPTNLAGGGSISITVNGSAQSVALAATDRISDIITKLEGNATLNSSLSFSNQAGELRVTAKNADVDFVVGANSTSAALGLTVDASTARTVDSTSLLDRLNTKLGGSAGQGATLTVSGNGGQAQTITFGTGTGQISTKAELTAALTSLGGGLSPTLVGTSLSFQVGASSTQTSLTFGGSAAAALGFTPGTTTGAVNSTTDNSTRAALQIDYNDVLTQIDTLAKDASYNGVNLLNGDNLKVVFNEKGTSTLTISGVTFGSAGLGLLSVSGTAFQSDVSIDATITSIDGALSTLRTQASKFGSSLTTVQTRQDFTKNLINTLQTGADALVLADSNEEGANLLALQTRQQLSSTALSLSAQADQAVLRLFG